MLYWHPSKSTQDRVVYRPSRRTLGHLLGISGMALSLLTLLTWYTGFPWATASDQVAQPKPAHIVANKELQKVQEFTEKLKQNLPPDARAELELNSAARAKQMQHRVEQNNSVRRTSHLIMTILYWVMYVCLCAIVALPPATYPFEWVTIQRSGNDLIVRKRGVWSVTRRWPLSTFGQILCYADPESRRSPGSASTIVGWRWMVKLGASAETWIEQNPSLVDDPEVMFFIEYQKTQPSNDEPLPGSVSTLIAHLQRLTEIESVVRGGVSVDRSLLLGDRVTQRYLMATQPKITRQIARSLEEVPKD